MPFDWRQLHRDEMPVRSVVDPRRRLRLTLAVLAALLAVVLGRAVEIEVTQAAAFRAAAVRPLEQRITLPGVRGRILARDGTVLACDKDTLAVAVHYRWLQEPPDSRWLREMAQTRLSHPQRKDPRQMAAAERQVCRQRSELARRLADLCGAPAAEWDARASRVQARVAQIIAAAKRRRQSEAAAASASAGPVSEELDYHVMADDVSPAVAARVEADPGKYPGVKIIRHARRTYPAGTLAAHVLGYLGPADAQTEAAEGGPDLSGRAGVERQYESLLRGRPGMAVERTDRSGRLLAVERREEPRPGRDLVLTLDPRLQQTAETLLDAALERRALRPAHDEPGGGAIAVMDLRDGALLAAASAPRFDPNVFLAEDAATRQALLRRPDSPLFDRLVQMALPPGSVFKTLTAIALVESAAVDPQQPFICQGYLHDPNQMRCEIYIHQGVGHGPVTLADALAQSCNVYFFHFAGKMGQPPLADWALRLGFGRPTGIDLPGEAAGIVPTPQSIRRLEGHGWQTTDTQMMAIGQGSLTATPLEVLRLLAAVATGRLITPHVAVTMSPGREPGDKPAHQQAGQAIAGLHPGTLAAVRQGLERVVADPKGTAYGSVRLESVAVAGKTGTASVGGGRREHAWFAGYMPAEAPKLAFVIVLEHAGDGAAAAGPVAKRLVVRMQQLGMF
jgi:penicillin-binding protein 2